MKARISTSSKLFCSGSAPGTKQMNYGSCLMANVTELLGITDAQWVLVLPFIQVFKWTVTPPRLSKILKLWDDFTFQRISHLFIRAQIWARDAETKVEKGWTIDAWKRPVAFWKDDSLDWGGAARLVCAFQPLSPGSKPERTIYLFLLGFYQKIRRKIEKRLSIFLFVSHCDTYVNEKQVCWK